MGVGRLVDHAVVTGSRGSVDPPRPLRRTETKDEADEGRARGPGLSALGRPRRGAGAHHRPLPLDLPRSRAPRRRAPVGASPAVGFSGTAGGTGDRTHCVGGREFSTSIDYYAPPCTPGIDRRELRQRRRAPPRG